MFTDSEEKTNTHQDTSCWLKCPRNILNHVLVFHGFNFPLQIASTGFNKVEKHTWGRRVPQTSHTNIPSRFIHKPKAQSRLICQCWAKRVDPLEQPGAECLMVFDSVQMDSHTVQRRSFTSFSAADEMNNEWISALMGAGRGVELIGTGSAAVGELRRCKQVLCLPHTLTEGAAPPAVTFSWHPP